MASEGHEDDRTRVWSRPAAVPAAAQADRPPPVAALYGGRAAFDRADSETLVRRSTAPGLLVWTIALVLSALIGFGLAALVRI